MAIQAYAGGNNNYPVKVYISTSINNNYSETQAKVTITCTGEFNTNTFVQSSGVMFSSTCDNQTHENTSILGNTHGGIKHSYPNTYSSTHEYFVFKNSSREINWSVSVYNSYDMTDRGFAGNEVGTLIVNAPCYTLSFDPYGGTVSPKSKIITIGSPYGDLPIPTKNGYKFVGWYTAASNGTKILDTDIVSVNSDITLYAHWNENESIIPTENEETKKVFQTTEMISLDIYNTNIKTINAKQLDSKSRYVGISCTEHGKKMDLDSNTMTAFVRYKRPDGKAVLDMCTILPDGTLIFELTQQMLLISGKAVADIMLFGSKIVVDNSDGDVTLPEDTRYLNNLVVTYDDTNDNVSVAYNQESGFTHEIKTIEDLEKIAQLKSTQLLSTMTLYINILPTTINHAEIVKSPQFDELSGLLDKMSATEKLLEFNEVERQTNEFQRQTEETSRQETEIKRQSNETQRNNRFNEIINCCNEVISDTTTAKGRATTAAMNAETATSDARAATKTANDAASEAQIAAGRCKTVIENAGGTFVLQTEKGVANGIPCLDENQKIPVEQLDIALAKIRVEDDGPETTLKNLLKELQKSINNMHKVYHGDYDPNEREVVGSRDGDIYMQIIKDPNEMAGE